MRMKAELKNELERIADRAAFQLKNRIWLPEVTELARDFDKPNTTRVFEASTRQWYTVDLSDAPQAIQEGRYNSHLYPLIKAALTPRRLNQ